MDFLFANHGSVCILTPVTEAAKEWREQHLPEDAQTWGAHGVVIEPRYVDAIIDGITAAGLSVG